MMRAMVSESVSPNTAMADAPADDGHDCRPPLAAHRSDPARGDGPDQGSDPGSGVEEPDRESISAKHLGAHGREQRGGHPEDHRIEVDEESGLDDSPALQIPETLGRPRRARAFYRPLPWPHRDMSHERGADQKHHHFYPVGEREPRRGDQQPGDGGEGGGGGGGQSLVQRQRGGEEGTPNQTRHDRMTGRRVDGRNAGVDRNQHINQPDHRCLGHRVPEQPGGGHRKGQLGDDQEPAAIDGVRQGPADHRYQEQRHQLGQPEQSDGQGRVGELEDLEGRCDDGHHAAGMHEEHPGKEPAITRDLAQWRHVHHRQPSPIPQPIPQPIILPWPRPCDRRDHPGS